jgi:hypothetical protein
MAVPDALGAYTTVPDLGDRQRNLNQKFTFSRLRPWAPRFCSDPCCFIMGAPIEG